MDTIPNSKDDQMLLGSLTPTSNVSIAPDNPIMTHPGETPVEINQTDGGGALNKTAPQPGALLPSLAEACTSPDVSQPLTSISRHPESFKSAEPDGEDLCAAILLACLFCQPLDCLLATLRGCNSWIWSLCASACGCESTGLQPLLDVTRQCDPCECVGPQCCLGNCSVCDLCRQTTECLDLAMEVSQMLYH